MLHIDVMDGLFVPNLSFGMPVVSSVRPNTRLPLDVHLMLANPVKYIEAFAKAGADSITVHVEADTEENTRLALERVRALGKRAGVVLKPKTPAEAALPFLDQCAMVLVMTVEPGFGGQSFMEDMLEKVRTLRGWIGGRGLDCELEVDGGIGPRTAPLAVEAGANVLVAGSAVYGAEDIPARIAELRG